MSEEDVNAAAAAAAAVEANEEMEVESVAPPHSTPRRGLADALRRGST